MDTQDSKQDENQDDNKSIVSGDYLFKIFYKNEEIEKTANM